MSKVPDKCPMCGEKHYGKKLMKAIKVLVLEKLLWERYYWVPQDQLEELQERRNSATIAENVVLIMNIRK